MPYIGNISDLKWTWDPVAAAKTGSPILINTPHLEVRTLVLRPGQRPPYHRHHSEMDEGYLIQQGRGVMKIDGEAFEVQAGDILLGKRGGYHDMENTGDEDIIEFNFRGGKMPSGTITPEIDEAPPLEDISATPGSRYILRNIFGERPTGVSKNKIEEGAPEVFKTPYLELFVFTHQTGDNNATHTHQAEMDEASYLVRGSGKIRFYIDGESVEGGEGDLIHIPGGSRHHVERILEGELIVLNMRGGKLPSITSWE